jgi:integrase
MGCGRPGSQYLGVCPKSFYGKTQAEALRKREEAKSNLGSGLHFDVDRLTLGAYMERWLEGPLKRSVATSTYEDYVYRARKYIIPADRRHKAQGPHSRVFR